MEVVWLFMLLMPWMVNSLGTTITRDVTLHITRQNIGDLFNPEGVTRGCKPETCVGLSSGTAQAAPGSDLCHCQCHPHLPAFREDLRICVDDIHECVLSPFVGGSTSQQIPFVFLPLKGQIIHPSKEISFAGIHTPVCAVSGAKFLTEAGWVDLRNPLDTDVPFRLFRDEGRTFLQWVGESDLRTKMSGRLVLVYLMCRELSEPAITEGNALFSPCVAFRVVGSPTKYLNNVSEVAFSPDAHASVDGSDHLSVSEYVAIGICSVLLGLIYVASVFLYLHLRKRNRDSAQKTDDKNLGSGEEGIIKNNPLLGMVAHFQPPDAVYSDSTNSDSDMAPDVIQHHDETRKKSSQVTSAMIHSQYKRNLNYASLTTVESILQDSSSIEKLPEENVSIVETLEGREERSDTLKAISGTVRRKLYFNPAYFEPQLLLAPPPAALEFLSKIREVITIAKQKMATKKFAPSLIVIPEEESNYVIDPIYDYSRPSISRRSSVISLKRENSRRKTCTGCPGCEPQDFRQLCGKLPEFPSLAACQTCASTATESKQRSIRKWLEDVPILKQVGSNAVEGEKHLRSLKRVRSPTKSLPPDGISTPIRALSPRPASDRGLSSERTPNPPIKKKTNQNNKSKAPSPPIRSSEKVEVEINHPPSSKPKVIMNFPPPDMIHEAMAVDNKTEDIRIPTLTKKQMKAVISEFSDQRGIVTDSDSPKSGPRKLPIDYETDSLERTGPNAGYNTPSEYAELSSSQPSPSLSTALPMDEEMTMRNAVFNKHTGNRTISKINVDILQEDDHDYELIVLKKGSLKKQNFYKLPELLQRSNEYSLVSEVYVNNGYNYNSAPSSSSSNCSTLDKRTLKVRYEEGVEKPGKLLIEVEDCADNYIPVNDSDGFEPDTLDRKPSKMKIQQRPKSVTDTNEFVDSLERPQQILLRSSGSFKKEMPKPVVDIKTSNFNRVFGSLREIYEAKTKAMKHMSLTDISDFDSDEGRLLTLEERHSKRQRRLTIGGNMVVPPDVIPPPLHDHPIYERPKPPRKIILADTNTLLKPPLPPKNGNGRSASNPSTVDDDIDTGTPVFQKLPEDSGYLSTNSNDSSQKKPANHDQDENCSESEESLDGHSESGAESVETHSVFFGTFRKPITPYFDYGSNDSGVDTVKIIPNHNNKQHYKASILVTD